MNSKVSKKIATGKREGLMQAIKSAAPRGILPSSLRGLAATIVCCAILLLTASAIVYSTTDPNHFVTPSALTVLYISCFIGGFVSAKCNRRAVLICGALTGVLAVSLLFGASLFLSPTLSSEYTFPLAIGLRGIAIAFSILGALAGSGKQKKKPTNRRNQKIYQRKGM